MWGNNEVRRTSREEAELIFDRAYPDMLPTWFFGDDIRDGSVKVWPILDGNVHSHDIAIDTNAIVEAVNSSEIFDTF